MRCNMKRTQNYFLRRNFRVGIFTLVSFIILIACSSSHAQAVLDFRRVLVDWPQINAWFQVRCGNNVRYDVRYENLLIKENGLEMRPTSLWCPDPDEHCCISVALVLDKSSLMQERYPSVLMQEKLFANTFIDAMNGACDEATIISSNDRQTVEVFMTNDRHLLSDGVTDIQPQGRSMIWDGALAAINEIVSNGIQQCRAVILITSGNDDGSSADISDIILLALANKLRVFTIGIGSYINESDLQMIATDTGGKFYMNPDAGQMRSIYLELSSALIGSLECKIEYTAQCPDGSRKEVELTLRDVPNCSGISTKMKTYKAPWDSTAFRPVVIKALDVEMQRNDTVTLPIILHSLTDNVVNPYSFELSFDTTRVRFLGYNTPFALLDTSRFTIERLAHSYRITSRKSQKLANDKIIGRLLFRVDSLNTSTPITLSNWSFKSGCLIPDVQSGSIVTKRPLRLLAPLGGEHFCMGKSTVIQWEKDSIDSIDVEISRDAGLTFTTIAKGITGDSFLWSISDTLAIGWYWIRLKASDGSQSTAIQTPFFVTNRLVIKKQPQDITCCASKNETALFSVAISHEPDFYQWQKSTDGGMLWIDIPFERTHRLHIGSVKASDDGLYRLLAVNVCDTVFSASARLRGDPKPIFTQQPNDVVVCEGNTARFTIQFQNVPHQIRWQISNDSGASFTDYVLSTRNTLEIPDVTMMQNTSIYRAIIRNECFAETSRVAMLKVLPSTAHIRLHPTSQMRCVGDSVSFSAAASNAVRTQWFFNANPIPGATDSVYRISNISFNNLGSYVFRAFDSCGSVMSASAFLEVLSHPVILTQPNDQVFREGQWMEINVRASGGQLQYQWYKNGIALPNWRNSGYQFLPVKNADSGLYSVRITNACGSVLSREARLSILVTNVEREHEQTAFALMQNYPNPFSEKTTIRFQIADYGFQIVDISPLDPLMVGKL